MVENYTTISLNISEDINILVLNKFLLNLEEMHSIPQPKQADNKY